ncbi:serine--tRNA ligase [Desulfovermiculus halophilus]|jgi:seryl-tRNA synthetase|uniref:serine--tRNA ligase n=1 Tax=Desulfovermiculus halophilus TaxID=339722 RepID=UPI000483B994|nr:serine--tRNA ligase [Desulfovermiculus halophilus]
MLDLKFMQKHPDVIRKALQDRGSDLDFDHFLNLDAKRKEIVQEVEDLRHERNQASDEVARLKRAGEDAESHIARLSKVADRIKELDARRKDIEQEIAGLRLSIPNIPHPDVPVGATDEDNRQVKTWGHPPEFDFQPKAHWDLGPQLGGLDFERAAKITGSRFALSWGWAARLERALISFMLDIQTQENGYLEVLPPFIVNEHSMQGTGQLPKFEEDLFKLEDWPYYLIPTAEVPVTNIHRDEVLAEEQLPLGYTAFTPCFRSEAGSYGKDTKGLIRQHQFNKVELVRFAHPEDSYDQLELLLGHAETILQRLELPYRVVTLCTGDLGFSAAKTYDIEVWLPGQNAYREISSCSNFEDFQARRANIRFQASQGKKKEFVHTLNGSGLAVGRALVAIIENCQQAEGSIRIPRALTPYMGGQTLISKEQA